MNPYQPHPELMALLHEALLESGDASAQSVLQHSPALQRYGELVAERCAHLCQRTVDSGDYDGRQQYAAAACRDAITRQFLLKRRIFK